MKQEKVLGGTFQDFNQRQVLLVIGGSPFLLISTHHRASELIKLLLHCYLDLIQCANLVLLQCLNRSCITLFQVLPGYFAGERLRMLRPAHCTSFSETVGTTSSTHCQISEGITYY